MLYFKVLCFVWAIIGLGSRFFMYTLKENWNSWEQDKAYKEKRPLWVVLVAILGIVLIIVTWTIYIVYDVKYGWILSLLMTLTIVKISNLLFRYDKFREFLKEILPDKKRMKRLNISVIILSIVLILMGLFLY